MISSRKVPCPTSLSLFFSMANDAFAPMLVAAMIDRELSPR
jgi:hypothetical protein